MKKIVALTAVLLPISSYHLLYAMSQVTTLMLLQSTLNCLTNKIQINEIGLIGEFLVGKKFKDILNPNQAAKIFMQPLYNDFVLVNFDQNERIYQLRALNQENDTCEIHSLRNILWMLNGLNGTLDNFVESYVKILDKSGFDEYCRATGCSVTGIISFEEQANNIKENKIACIAHNSCLPQSSVYNIDSIFSFTLARHPANDLGKFWMGLRTFAENELTKVETATRENIDLYANTVAMFYPVFRDSDILKLYDFIKKDKFCFGLDLGIEVEPLGHAICLIAHKVNNQIEYLLLDTYDNQSSDNYFNNYKYRYSSSHLINSIKYLIEDIAHFKQTLIRRAYLNLKKHLEQNNGLLAGLINNLNVFIDDQYEPLKLLNEKLYAIYKPYFCKLINESINRDVDNKEKYEEILNIMRGIS